MWIRCFVAGMLLCSPLVVCAAGFDCKQAANSAEHAICDDPTLSSLDGQMTAAYTQALHRAANAQDNLMRDQRNWLAERNEMASRLYEDDSVQRENTKGIERAYQQRIDFLNHLFVPAASPSALLEAIAQKLSASPAPGDYDYQSRWKTLGGDGSVFDVPTEQAYAVGEVGKHMPIDDEAGLANVIGALSSTSSAERVTLALLPSAKFGGLYQVGGTLSCVTWSLFAWHGQTIESINTPENLGQNCWTTEGVFASFSGQIYAIADSVNLTSSDISVQPWTGNDWGAQRRLLARYDYTLSQPTAYCEHSSKDCDALTALADAYAKRYSRSRVGDILKSPLSEQEQESFDAMLKAAPDEKRQVELPTFGATIVGYPDFADGSVWFAARMHGELLLGRIGHGGLGWRSDDNWYVGFWRWDGASLSPVIGVVVPVQRADFLLSANVRTVREIFSANER
jgi:uncharacterized protein